MTCLQLSSRRESRGRASQCRVSRRLAILVLCWHRNHRRRGDRHRIVRRRVTCLRMHWSCIVRSCVACRPVKLKGGYRKVHLSVVRVEFVDETRENLGQCSI
jgi:hypothetical protein